MVSPSTILSTLAALAPVISAATTMAAVGIAVSDLARSQAFYTSALGLQPNGMAFNTTSFDEIVMALPGKGAGSAIVLMKWKAANKQTQDLAVKLVFYVDDMARTWGNVRAAGGKVVNEPGSLKLGNTSIPTAFAKDPDGYLIELNPVSIMGKGVPKGR
jgi:lactoylglutathione lyase